MPSATRAGVSVPTSATMYNDVYYKGAWPGDLCGLALNDITVQTGGLSGTINNWPHPSGTGFSSEASPPRGDLATTILGRNDESAANASIPIIDRFKTNAAGCDNGGACRALLRHRQHLCRRGEAPTASSGAV